MKKTLFIIAACALAAVSCQKETAVENGISSEGILTVTADIAQFDVDTKTSIDGTATTIRPLWSEGDEIKLFATDGTSAVYVLNAADKGKSSGTFTLKGGETALAGTFACAYYPAANATAYTDGTGITATISDAQAYVAPVTAGVNAGTFANGSFPMVGTGTLGAEKGNLDLTFKNVFGLVQLNFTGTETIKEINLKSEKSLSGTATIATDDNRSCTITNGKKYVTLTFSAPVTLDNSTPTAFYVAVPADSTVSRVYVTTSTDLRYKAKYITASRSQIKSLNSNTLTDAGFTAVTYSEASTLTPQIINGTIWAPVNCGYDADHLCGKLYQWGRMDGGGYYNSASTTPASDASDKVIQTNVVDLNKGTYTTSEPASNTFYKNPHNKTCDWYTNSQAAQFSSWPMTAPSNTSRIGNPCPSGWRVPTSDELGNLVFSDWDSSTQKGTTIRTYTFSSGYGTINGLTLPAAGRRDYDNGNSVTRSSDGHYWSSTVLLHKARCLQINSSKAYMTTNCRAYGTSVRCVQE